jgi:hypothetical protein
MKRPIDIFMNFGVTGKSRKVFKKALIDKFKNSRKIITEYKNLSEMNSVGNIVILERPYLDRIPIEEVFRIQSLSKITVSLNGNGTKCFRDAEAPFNSLMARQENNMIWVYPWIDRINSIILPSIEDGNFNNTLNIEKSLKKLEISLNNDNLYSVYVDCVLNSRKYFYKNYMNYICDNILYKLNIKKKKKIYNFILKKDIKDQEALINQTCFRS